MYTVLIIAMIIATITANLLPSAPISIDYMDAEYCSVDADI